MTNFRNHAAATLELGAAPVVLVGPNGAGKTNLLEAVSLLAPGQGLRRAPFPELARTPGTGEWAVAARLGTPSGTIDVGTGMPPAAGRSERAGRLVRINGEPQASSGTLGDSVDMVWLTPSMDGLFTGPAADRRRFLDRLVLCVDRGFRTTVVRFERAMQQRNRLLVDGVWDTAQFEALEAVLAEAAVALAAARLDTAARLEQAIASRRERAPAGPFPWARIAVEGTLESELALRSALEVEEAYLAALRIGRDRDRAAGRTLEGPHRSNLVVWHGPKGAVAKMCSTGEQKALLIGLVLAHAELVRQHRGGSAPVILLDEIAAHLDEQRRSALWQSLLDLGIQAWLTGTELRPFEGLEDAAQVVGVEDGRAALRGRAREVT